MTLTAYQINPQRIPISGYFSSATPSALSENNSRLTLRYYDPITGAAVALATQGSATGGIGTDDFIELTDCSMSIASTGLVTVYHGADNVVDAGEAAFLLRGTSGHASLAVPHRCVKATYPKIKSSLDAACEVTVHGFWNRYT
jgi:hypothetical protein